MTRQYMKFEVRQRPTQESTPPNQQPPPVRPRQHPTRPKGTTVHRLPRPAGARRGRGIGQIVKAYLNRLNRAHTAVLSFAAGVAVGLVLLGWWLWPVQWTNLGLAHLRADDQTLVIENTADLYSYTLNPIRVARTLYWDDGTAVCRTAAQTTDPYLRLRLVSIAAIRNGYGCDFGE